MYLRGVLALKKILSLITVMLFVIKMPVCAETLLEISAPSGILIEASTGKVLFEKNADNPLPPASVTKIMTMLLVMEAMESGQIKEDDIVVCSENAASMGGSQVYLEAGEEMTVHDMLKAVAVASGNDAAVALAEFVSGSSEGFVELMNKRAKELGMENTSFKNCNGLDTDGHLTTARDIATMSKELISHPKIFEFTSIWMDSLRNGEFGLVNTNKLIRFYDGANGLKTGSTGKAKFCLSASAKRNDMNLIAVVMAAETSKKRFADASKMLDYGFANYTIVKSLLTDEELGSIKIKKGKTPILDVMVDPNFNVLTEKSKIGNIEKNITMPETVDAPVKKGEKLGEVEFLADGVVLGKADILAKADIERITPVHVFSRLAKTFLLGKSE